MSIWLWFIGTKVGRFIMAGVGLLSGLLLVYLKGKSDQKANEALKTLKQSEEVKRINNEVDSLNDDDLRNRASKWVRK